MTLKVTQGNRNCRYSINDRSLPNVIKLYHEYMRLCNQYITDNMGEARL